MRKFVAPLGFCLSLLVCGALFIAVTMLNPDGDFVKAFDSPNMALLAIVVAMFCVFSVAVWFYFNGLGEQQRE